MNPMDMMKMAGIWKGFTDRHPKFPAFLRDVYTTGLRENTVIDIKITTPEGREILSNLRVRREDLEALEQLKSMSPQK